MTKFIILSGADILTLCDDKPVTVYVDKKPYVLCTDEYFEKQRNEPQESDNRRCGNCKYFGEVLKENDTPHSCNNNKSIFKACLETATGCEKFEPQESEE